MDTDDEKIVAVDEKLEELIALLSQTHINGEVARYFTQQFDHAIRNANKDSADTHSELYDHAEILHEISPQSNNRLKRYLQAKHISNIIFIIIDIIMILIGLGMIILPATPFFKMFPIYYISRNDGVTVMDLISLLIILAGVYFLIREIYPNPNPRKKNIDKFNQQL